MRRITAAVTIGLVAAMAPSAASAHDGLHAGPWNLEPLLLPTLLLAAIVYGRGVEALWRSAGPGRGIASWQVGAFAGGLALLGIALLSPLEHRAGESLAAHMVQHMLLMQIAAPLLVLGAPLLAVTWALPPRARRPFGRLSRIARPRPSLALATALVGLHAALLLLWHLPAAYDAAVASRWLHDLQHASFFLPALLFWSVALPLPGQHRHRRLAGLAMIFGVMLASTGLGALMAVSPSAWYASYALQDQQLAGALMWVVGGSLYAAVAAWLFLSWLATGRRGDASKGRAPRPTPAISGRSERRRLWSNEA